MTHEIPLSVLLVDSDPFMREIFGLILAHHDVPHHAVQDAEAALAYLRQNKVSIVIVDCSVPGSESEALALAQRIHAGNLAPGARLVATSIFDWNGTPAESSERGFDGFIPKPFDVSNVVPYLREIAQTTQVYDE